MAGLPYDWTDPRNRNGFVAGGAPASGGGGTAAGGSPGAAPPQPSGSPNLSAFLGANQGWGVGADQRLAGKANYDAGDAQFALTADPSSLPSDPRWTGDAQGKIQNVAQESAPQPGQDEQAWRAGLVGNTSSPAKYQGLDAWLLGSSGTPALKDINAKAKGALGQPLYEPPNFPSGNGETVPQMPYTPQRGPPASGGPVRQPDAPALDAGSTQAPSYGWGNPGDSNQSYYPFTQDAWKKWLQDHEGQAVDAGQPYGWPGMPGQG